MSSIRDYLNKNHTQTTFDELSSDFMEKFGVGIKQEGDLYQFKYNMLAAKWLPDNITRQSRGIIIRKDNGIWSIVSQPFDKFFNQHEGHCPYFKELVFNGNISNFFIAEKVDGSCIQLYWDDTLSTYRVSTLGTITPMNVGDYDFTFSELFWKTLGIPAENINEKLFKKGITYIFELCCTENRILTKYPSNTIYLLGCRDINHGTHANWEEQNSWIRLAVEMGANVRMPYYEHLSELGLNTLDDVKLFVQRSTAHTDKYGEYPEGFILYESLVPVAKMKNEQYVSLHRISGGDHLHTRNVVIDSYFAGTVDDIVCHLTDPLKEFADSLKVKVEALFLRIQHVFAIMNGMTFETQKDYAMFLQKNVEREFWPFFFTKKNDILDSSTDHMDLFTTWLSLSYKKFIDYWKAK